MTAAHVLSPEYTVLYMLSHPHVCDQLLWINGYSCALYIVHFLRCQIIKNISDPAQWLHRVWGRGGGWQLLTQQADEQPNFEWYRQKLLAGKEKENSQIFDADFYLPLYLPLWGGHSPAAKGVGESQFQRLEKRLALCLLCGGR